MELCFKGMNTECSDNSVPEQLWTAFGPGDKYDGVTIDKGIKYESHITYDSSLFWLFSMQIEGLIVSSWWNTPGEAILFVPKHSGRSIPICSITFTSEHW